MRFLEYFSNFVDKLSFISNFLDLKLFYLLSDEDSKDLLFLLKDGLIEGVKLEFSIDVGDFSLTISVLRWL